MADVTIKYKGATIAEMSGTSEKTLKTGGTYCEGDIDVVYAPRTKTYEITLAKASGWVLLTTLEDEVLAHINDEGFAVSLVNVSPYEYVYYSGSSYLAGNIVIGIYSENNVYGIANREQGATNMRAGYIYSPANSTATDVSSSSLGAFRVSGAKYYIKPGNGYIKAGTYRLTFTW